MKVFIVAAIVMVSMVAGQPDKHPFSARLDAAPYAPRGWRPQGATLNLPNQPQKQSNPPTPRYGPPSVVEATTNKSANATEPAKVSAATQEEHKNAYFIVLPKSEPQISQNFVYTELPNQAVLTVPQSAVYATANLQALPISAYYASLPTPVTVPQSAVYTTPNLQAPISAYSTAYYASLPTPYVVEW